MRSRSVWMAVLGAVALMPALLLGCNREATVRVDCAEPQSVLTRIGLLNTTGLQLGSVFVVNTATRKERSLGTFAPVLNEISRTAREDDLRLPIFSGLSASVSGPSNLPADLAQSLASHAAEGSVFRVRGRQSRSIFNVGYYVHERGTLYSQIASLPPPAAGTDVVYLVTTESTAEAISIGLGDAIAAGADPSSGEVATVAVGGYVLRVEYQGLPQSLAAGSKGPAFVRATPLRFLPDDEEVIVDVTQELDLSTCDLSAAATPQ